MEALLVYPSSFACLKINSRGYPHRICFRQCAKLRRELGASRQKTLRIRCILVQDMVGRTPLAMIRELVAVGVAATAPPATSSLPAMALVMVTQMAMTAAAAMVCAAYLSPPLDEIWQRPRIIEDLPAATLIDGIDVTGYNIFQEPMVQEAIQYAKEAHAGQTRKTGEPYVTHCIHTARILAALVPSHGKRAVHTVVAGILHDVIDDTNRTLRDIQELFGDDVCKLVAGVSKLSYVNQVLRRHRRTTAHRRASSMNGLSSAEVDSLRVMLLGMVDDPRVVLIKLADRLHNMRTLYALPSAKACAVAQETLAVWCSLASRLGAWALKSELEDLCFAVLQPLIFRQLRTALAAMWSPDADWRHLRRVAKKTRGIDLQHDDATNTGSQVKEQQHEEDIVTTKELIETVIPFDMQSDRRTRMQRLQSVDQNLKNRTSVLQEEETILKALGICEDVLYKELVISTSYIPGTEVALSGRLKSLYSIHCKMLRKGVDLGQVYDARALRVIVGDGEGRLQAAAIEGCYFLLSIIHRLWTPINGEFDDYILNPKSSGYQSLHTAVRGPDGAPLEVQIRTKSMHEYAEYGHAAHWLYKESVNLPSASSDTVISNRKNGQINNNRVNMLEGVSNLSTDKGFFPRQLQLGHPALRVEGGRLLAAVIMRIDEGGKELLVAVSFALQAREAIAAGRSGNQRGQWVAYAKLYNKVSKKWWFSPGHGDWSSCLERYVLCSDGIYHKQDQFKRLLPTFIQPLELSNEEIEEYQEVVTMVNEGKEIYDEGIANANSKSGHQTEALTIARLNNKVKFLRSMLQWEQEVWNEASSHGRSSRLSPDHPNSVALTEVLIVRWPDGEIMRMPSGSTAADAARRMGLDGKFVYVNGQVAYPSLQLKDGDIMELRA